MASTPGVGSIWRYTIHMKRAGQTLQTSTLLSPSHALSQSDYLTFCSAFLASQYVVDSPLGVLVSTCGSGVSFVGHTIQAIYPVRLVGYFTATATGFKVGSLNGSDLPVNCSAAWDRYTEDGTRAGRGSLHPPCGTTDLTTVDVGSWADTFVNTMTAAALKWTSAMVDGNGDRFMFPVLWRKDFPTVINRFIGVKVNPNLRVMRRRTVGLGK